MHRPDRDLVYVFIKLQRRNRATIAAFEDRVRRLPQIGALVAGPHDDVLTIHIEDMNDYNHFCARSWPSRQAPSGSKPAS